MKRGSKPDPLSLRGRIEGMQIGGTVWTEQSNAAVQTVYMRLAGGRRQFKTQAFRALGSDGSLCAVRLVRIERIK